MLIVDMPMPKFCIWRDDKNEPHRCPLINEDDDCVLQESNIYMCWNEQYAHCPIKGVLPEEHGDLIDRSLLCADLVGVILSHRGLSIDEVIARQPAIIAAERKDDGTTAD